MNNRLRRSIQQILLAGSVAAFASSALAVPTPGVQIPPPGPGQVPDYFGVTPNYATSPEPVMAKVTIADTGGGTGAAAAATTYDYNNPNYAINPHGLYTGKIMDVQLVSGGGSYTAATTVTVQGGSGTPPITLTPIIVNGVIVAFNEIPHGDIYDNSINPPTLIAAAGPTLFSGLPHLAPGTVGPFTVPVTGTGIRKFVDSLSLPAPIPMDGSLPAIANNLHQYMPIAQADTTTFPGSDYYVIGEVEYTQKMHSDLPASNLRGYVQLQEITGSGGAAPTYTRIGTPQYMGPVIIAKKNRPVRMKVVNLLSKSNEANGLKGNLPFPVDHTYMGAEKQDPNGLFAGGDTDNRTSIHLHGGVTPWISDGTPRQWMKPAAEPVTPNKGVSATNVPDMWFDGSGNLINDTSCVQGTTTCTIAGATNNPGDGALTFYYTNQQSARLMFYHDHAEGTTRLNVYAGLAAGYILQDPTEYALIHGGTAYDGAVAMGYSPTDAVKYDATITYQVALPPASDMIPLVIQERTFVPSDKTPVLNFYGAFKSQLNSQDPTWHWGTGFQFGTAPTTETNGTGDLWVPHVYMTNQNPGDVTGANALGRWDYGQWFWPPYVGVTHAQIPNPYYDPLCNTTTGAGVNPALGTCEGANIPGLPNGWSDTSNLPTDYLTNNPTALTTAMKEPSGTPEAFNDTPIVNGTAYPFMNVSPKKYRLRILSVGNDRTLNLSLFVASNNSVNVDTTSDGNVGATSTVAKNNTCDAGTNHLGASYADFCTEVRMVPWNATQNIDSSFPTWWYTSQKGGVTFDGRPGGVPDPLVRGPAMVQIGTEGGFLSNPAVIGNQPINYEYNLKNIQVTNVKEHALLLGPAERADVVVDFSQFKGSTIILYNDAPAAIPAFDLRLDYFTGNFDNTDTGGAFSTVPGYGPNSRTLMQFRVAAGCPSGDTTCGAGINRTPSNAATPDDFDPADIVMNPNTRLVTGGRLATAVRTAFKYSQEPIIVPQAAYNDTYGLTGTANAVSDGLGTNTSRITDSNLSFVPFSIDQIAGSLTFGQLTFESLPISLNMGPKTIQELFTTDYGRMNATLGTEIPNTTGINQTTIPLGYIDPPTELVTITKDEGINTVPIGQMADGTQLWKITHNGVDTHAIHVHLFHVQIVNRVGWDGAIYPPEPNELGWKDTIRMNPLADVIVALRPKTLNIPSFKIPNSHRLMDSNQQAGGLFNLSNLDPTTGNASNVTNQVVNYGWEYVWHCHILGHEENDMMRSIAVAQPPEDPSALTASANADGSIQLNWVDNSVISNWVTIQRNTVPATTITTINVPFTECASQTSCARTYKDTPPVGFTYSYNVVAHNTVGAGDTRQDASDAPLPTGVTAPALTPGFTGYKNVTASSAQVSSPAAGVPIIPVALLSAAPADFGSLLVGTTSATAQTVTLSNTGGTAPLTISSIAPTGTGGPFIQTNTCGVLPAILAINASCTISVSFKPTGAGAQAGSLTITDNAVGSPQTVALSGTGVAPATPSLTTSLGGLGVGLSWTASSPVPAQPDSYQVQRTAAITNNAANQAAACPAGGTYANLGATTTALTATDTTALTANRIYCYRVIATNAAGTFTSTGVKVITPAAAPVAPNNLTISSITATGLTVNWGANGGTPTGYEVQQCIGLTTTGNCAAAGAGWASQGTTISTSYSASGLSTGTPYLYRVRAYNTLTSGFVTSTVVAFPLAVADNPLAAGQTYTALASTAATQSVSAGNVLTNDLPTGPAASKTVTNLSAVSHTGGITGSNGAATATPSCTTAGVCTLALTSPAANTTGPQRLASKRGTYTFTYTETYATNYGSNTSVPVTVTVIVN